MRESIQQLWTYRLRFVTVFFAIFALLFAIENVIFQRNALYGIQSLANKNAALLLVVETTSASLVAVRDGDTLPLSELDWRDHYPGLYDTINSFISWPLFGGMGCIILVIGATVAVVFLSTVQWIRKFWTAVRIAIIFAGAIALTLLFGLGWPSIIVVIVAAGLAAYDQSFAFTVSILMTVAIFTLLNNRVASSRWSQAGMQQHLTTQFTLRDEFLDTFGRRKLPEGNTGWFTESAKHYLDSADYVGEGLEVLSPIPSNSTDKTDRANQEAERLRAWLDKSDFEIITRLKKQYQMDFRIMPRPANRILGIRSSYIPAFPSDQLQTPSIKTLTANEIERRIESFVGPAENGTKRIGIPLFAVLLSNTLERIHTDELVVASRRINGPIQFMTVLPCIFCLLLMGLRWRNNIDLVEGDLAEHKEWADTISQLNPVRVGVVKNAIAQKRDPCGEMLFAALTAFQSNFSQTDAATQVREIADSRINSMVSEYNMFRYIAWVIPSIGFVGTVLGIGDALLRANKLADPSADTSAALQAVIGELGVAFDTTLVALLTSILLMAVFHRLQRREEALVLEGQDLCLEKVVRVLTSKPAELDEAEIQVKGGKVLKKRISIIDVSDNLKSMEGPYVPEEAFLVVRIGSEGRGLSPVHEIRLTQLLPDSRCRLIRQIYGTHSVFDKEINHASRRSHEAVASWLEAQPEKGLVLDGKSWTELASYHKIFAASGNAKAVKSVSSDEEQHDDPTD